MTPAAQSVELEVMGPDAVVGRLRDEVADVWRRVFPTTTEERFAEILPRHAARAGFRFVAAREGGGALAGFAYGYTGGPGQWWHDRVAARLGREASERWLGPGHFELVELQVRPDLQGRGIGALLHDAVLDGATGVTAVLSTEQTNEGALRFYRRRGWQVVLDDIRFGPEYPPFVVLGKDLG